MLRGVREEDGREGRSTRAFMTFVAGASGPLPPCVEMSLVHRVLICYYVVP
jgi:hypothetical protein